MKIILLRRVAQNQHGTFGVLINDPIGKNMPFAVTFELPWHDNDTDISCIPAGKYNCYPLNHEDRGLVYVLKDVPGRKDVMIHVGNKIEDSKGCILPGEMFQPINGEPAVWYSGNRTGQGMNELRSIIGIETFQLVIKNPISL